MCAYRVDVGTTTTVCFHGFEHIPEEEEVESPEFRRLGHKWTLGIEKDDEDEVHVYLNNKSDGSINIECSFSVRDSNRREVIFRKPRTRHVTGFAGDSNYAGEPRFAKLSTLLRALVDGALTIEVGMRKVAPGRSAPTPVFIPENPLCENILKNFLDKASADVTFEVDGGDGGAKGEHKRAKTSPTVFHAHRSVLRHGAPTLAELCTPREGEGKMVSVQISGVPAIAFRMLLYYAYGGKFDAAELTNHARDLINAADRYGLASLKLEAEASYVESTTFTADNILDNLLYAHSKNCALLQEAAMDFVVANSSLVMDEVSFDDVPRSMMKDLLAAMTRGKKEGGADDANDYNGMRVGTLRKMLHEKGLEVDGSREAMVALLRRHP